MRAVTRWTEARLRAARALTPSVRELLIEPAGGPLPYAPGSHLEVQVLVGPLPETRTYSLVGAEPVDGAYRIAVRRQPEGRGGSLYMWSLEPGARIALSGPRNLFALTPGRPDYLLVAGGIGITPLVSMAQALARSGSSFRLLYCGRSRGEMPLLDELDGYAEARVSDEGTRLDLDAEIARLHPGGELYLCGPLRLIDDARRAWRAAGRPPARLRFETFASSGAHPPEPFHVTVVDHGVELDVPQNRTLLEALEDSGIGMLSDCLRGECGLCVVEVVGRHGDLDHRDVFLSDDEKTEGSKLCACVSRVVGGSIAVDTGYRP
jgi:vanillate O-demethylase ferredoxin subunit